MKTTEQAINEFLSKGGKIEVFPYIQPKIKSIIPCVSHLKLQSLSDFADLFYTDSYNKISKTYAFDKIPKELMLKLKVMNVDFDDKEIIC